MKTSTPAGVGDATVSEPEVAVDDRLCLALHAAARAMDAAYRPLLDELGLTYPQYLVLSVLWEDGSQRVGDLALRLSLDISTVSPLLKRLEARGLLVRHRDPDDERRVLVDLTQTGSDARHASAGIGRRVGATTGLDTEGQADLVVRLRTLTAALAGGVDRG